jgi:hypothetical protein
MSDFGSGIAAQNLRDGRALEDRPNATAKAQSGWIDGQSIFRVKLDPVLLKVEMLLVAIRAVTRA